MKRDAALVEHLLEMLAPMGGITAKSMFGGWAIYQEHLTFALVAEGVLYFKAGPGNRQDFTDLSLGPFTFETARGPVSMSYYQAPEFAMDNPLELRKWAAKAVAEASTAKSKSTAAKKRPAKRKLTS